MYRVMFNPTQQTINNLAGLDFPIPKSRFKYPVVCKEGFSTEREANDFIYSQTVVITSLFLKQEYYIEEYEDE